MPFAGAILMAHLLGVSSLAIQVAAVAFVLMRVGHALGMIMGWARMPIRPILFTAGYLATIIICVEIVRLSLR